MRASHVIGKTHCDLEGLVRVLRLGLLGRGGCAGLSRGGGYSMVGIVVVVVNVLDELVGVDFGLRVGVIVPGHGGWVVLWEMGRCFSVRVALQEPVQAQAFAFMVDRGACWLSRTL